MFTKKYTVKKFNITKRQLRVAKRDVDYYLNEVLDNYLHLYNSYEAAELKAEVVSENSIMYKCRLSLYMDDKTTEEFINNNPSAGIEFL